jgi:uncharacterized protein (UPF0276 family)
VSRPDLGVGLTWSSGLDEYFDRLTDTVDVIEIEPETAWWETGDDLHPWRVDHHALDRLRSFPQPKLIHGVSNPVGGTRQPDPRRLRLFAETARTLGVVLASEHLAFNRADGPGGDYGTGFLLPPIQTRAAVEVAVNAVRQFQAALQVPFSIETGVNYLRPRPGELADGQFAAAIAERADCGILLDLHNVWTNARNGRQPVGEFLAQLPLERVWEVHLAGGMNLNGLWLDAHCGPTPPDVLALLSRLMPRLPSLRAVVFELMPTRLSAAGIETVRQHLRAIGAICRGSQNRPTARTSGTDLASRPVERRPVQQQSGAVVPDPASWENRLGALVVRAPAPPVDDNQRQAEAELANDPGVGVLRLLVDHARAGTLVSVLPATCRVLAQAVPGGLMPLFRRYFSDVRPSMWGSAEAAAFVQWLRHTDLAASGLGDALTADNIDGVFPVDLERGAAEPEKWL